MIYYYGLRFEDWIEFCIYKATDYFVGQRNILQPLPGILAVLAAGGIAFGASKLYRSKKNRIAE